jgi:hypothetical protein
MFDMLQVMTQCTDVFEYVGEAAWFEKMGEIKAWKSQETKV